MAALFDIAATALALWGVIRVSGLPMDSDLAGHTQVDAQSFRQHSAPNFS
jgi:hypothetical protein